MRKMKIACLVIAILLVVAGVALMHIEFSHPELRNAVASRLSASLGIPVRMEKLSLRLSQGIKVKNLSLGAEDAEILSAKGIILQCNFLQMLRRQFNVRSVVVEKPVLTLRKEQIGFLLLPLIATSQHSSSSNSEFQFQLAEARVRSGKVNVEREESGSLAVDEIDLEVSSEGKGKPVKIKGAGTMQAFDFSMLGSYQAGEKSPVDFRITTDVDWSRINETLSKLNLRAPANLKGRGKSTVDIILTGSPGELNVDVTSDLTENELSYGNLHKPGGFVTKFKMSSVYSSGSLRVDDIVVIIGEGRLTGSGEILQGGKYKFSIKGENIDMEKLLSIKEKDEVKLNMSGKAKMQAQIANSGGGTQGLNGGGSLQIQNGLVKSFSWLEDLFSTINLPELMPFKYTKIIGSFNIIDGKVDITETIVHGEDAVLATEEGEIDLVKKTKNISADLALAPHLVKRQRFKFKEFDKFFYVDENGFAHLAVVWRGPLSKGTPDLTASFLKTGIKKYGSELLEKLFGEDED